LGRWLIINVPPWLLLTGMIIAFAGSALILGRFLRNHAPVLKSGAHNDALRFVYSVIGLVYAFFVGFIVSGLWGEVSAADDLVQGEVAAAIQVARDRRVFDTADADRLRDSLMDYQKAVREEWPRASVDGSSSVEADEAIKQLYSVVGNLQPRTDVQKIFMGSLVGNLEKMSNSRSERLIQANNHQGASWVLWVVVIATSVMVLGAAILFGIDNPRIYYWAVVTVGALVAVNMFLILDVSYPYLGSIATTPSPIHIGVSGLAETGVN
jgi:hypothetical protein